MTQEYSIKGMTCGSCVAKVKTALEGVPGVTEADIRLEAQQGTLQLNQPIPTQRLQEAIGHYQIEELPPAEPVVKQETHIKAPVSKLDLDVPEVSLTTYKPLILIVGFLLGVSLLAQYPFNDFSAMLWMQHFMAGFFLTFAFFKLLNIQGFADSYRMYDIIAARWKTWGYIYPFVELGLGVMYFINAAPFVTNIITIVVLGISSIGVIKSKLDKRKIKCACLGDVFNLPMSTVTIVENLSMVAMAALMLLMY